MEGVSIAGKTECHFKGNFGWTNVRERVSYTTRTELDYRVIGAMTLVKTLTSTMTMKSLIASKNLEIFQKCLFMRNISALNELF